ncbi:hypothetical protein TNIN_22331 [Trichonephila inaurata madagascariensis]|uniref:Uncharacterized protein n=1 Tax=Trichonephila inaurata madagascariensis TaxID=2747483 RepID=A0A8X6YDR1_9ARAC|nr:hypothetical protein TNIN_22331 [Trichonephila inaurata madagascariensis]
MLVVLCYYDFLNIPMPICILTFPVFQWLFTILTFTIFQWFFAVLAFLNSSSSCAANSVTLLVFRCGLTCFDIPNILMVLCYPDFHNIPVVLSYPNFLNIPMILCYTDSKYSSGSLLS